MFEGHLQTDKFDGQWCWQCFFLNGCEQLDIFLKIGRLCQENTSSLGLAAGRSSSSACGEGGSIHALSGCTIPLVRMSALEFLNLEFESCHFLQKLWKEEVKRRYVIVRHDDEGYLHTYDVSMSCCHLFISGIFMSKIWRAVKAVQFLPVLDEGLWCHDDVVPKGAEEVRSAKYYTKEFILSGYLVSWKDTKYYEKSVKNNVFKADITKE